MKKRINREHYENSIAHEKQKTDLNLNVGHKMKKKRQWLKEREFHYESEKRWERRIGKELAT